MITRALSPFCPSKAGACSEARKIPSTGTLASHATEIALDPSAGQLSVTTLETVRMLTLIFWNFSFAGWGASRCFFYLCQGQGQVELNKINLEHSIQHAGRMKQSLLFTVKVATGVATCASFNKSCMPGGGLTSRRQELHPKQTACQHPQKNASQKQQAHCLLQWVAGCEGHEAVLKNKKHGVSFLYFTIMKNWKFMLSLYRVNIRTLMAHKKKM